MRTIVILLLSSIFLSVYSQNDFKHIIEQVNWQGTETDIVNTLNKYIEKSEHNEWKSESSESNYCFKNVSILDIPVKLSYIRVNEESKKIYRLNFIFLYYEKDLSLYRKIEKYLIENFGESDNLVWFFDNYKMEAELIDISDARTPKIEQYIYTISLEPIRTFYVDWEKATINTMSIIKEIPKIKYFRIDNESNIYICEYNKMPIMESCVEKFTNSKGGDVFVLESGSRFAYSEKDSTIHYSRQGYIIYPIIRR